LNSIGYPCCSSLSMKTSGYDDQWGYEDNDWCRLTDEQELEYKENLKKVKKKKKKKKKKIKKKKKKKKKKLK